MRTWLTPRIAWISRAIQDVRWRRLRCAQRSRNTANYQATGLVNRSDLVLHVLRAKRSIFVVETIACAVRRSHVKLNKVDVLADDVCRRAHLKIVDRVVVRYQIGVPILDDVATVAAEEKRLRWTRASRCIYRIEVKCRLHVFPQRKHTLLREVPALRVECDVKLKRRGLVNALSANWLSLIIHGRIGERRSRLWTKRQSI